MHYIPKWTNNDKKRNVLYNSHARDTAMKILIGEDDRDISKIYERILQSRGHSVTVAANGTECVNLYRIESNRSDVLPFDMVILDQQMPLKSGTDTAREILQENPDIQIVFISAFGGQVIHRLKENQPSWRRGAEQNLVLLQRGRPEDDRGAV